MYLIYALQDPNTKENRKKIKDSNGNIFSSCTEAAKFYSCSGGMITFCLKNKKALRKTIYFEVING